MITYQEEAFNDVIDGLKELNLLHWEETEIHKDKVPFDIDYEAFAQLDNVGILHLMTVRDNDKLIGYYASIVTPSLHHKGTLFAASDVIYIAKDYRDAKTGSTLISKTEESLKKLGVKVMHVTYKSDHPLDKLLNRLGFEMSEITYSKYIGVD